MWFMSIARSSDGEVEVMATELERIAVLETKVDALEQDKTDRRVREQWIIGALIALAGVTVAVVTVVLTYVH